MHRGKMVTFFHSFLIIDKLNTYMGTILGLEAIISLKNIGHFEAMSLVK